jgi:hypothetical protein
LRHFYVPFVCRTEARQHGGMLHPIREPRFVELVVFAYVE